MESKVGFALIGLKTEQFAIFEENYSAKKQVGLNTGIEFKINKEKKQIGVFATFTFDQAKKAFLKLQISSHYAIAPDSWEEYSTDGNIVFPKGFMSHLTIIAVGSARGVLHAKTEGSEFNKFLLPTIDVSKLVNEDAEFSLE